MELNGVMSSQQALSRRVERQTLIPEFILATLVGWSAKFLKIVTPLPLLLSFLAQFSDSMDILGSGAS